VRYRVVFPTAILTGTAIHEIPFGALERSQNQEFPAQNWIDFGDGRRGLSLINRGIPGNNVTDGKLMLSLMRSATLGNYPESDLDPSTEGLGIGKTYSFDYALIVHTRDWRAATPWRAGMEFNSPLIVRTAAPHQGKLPPRWGLIEITNDNVVLSALKLSRGGASVLRIYEASGRPEKNVRIHFSTDINQVHETNLLEDEISAAESNRGDFYLDLRPFEIKTFKLRILPPT
jgi:alpha-mannosidase